MPTPERFSFDVLQSAHSGVYRPLQEHDMKNNTLAIALAALLVGGVATAGFINNLSLIHI